MHLTVQLGECYLWVVSFCIEQDNTADCKRQIGLMDQIYSNAVVTIVAASARMRRLAWLAIHSPKGDNTDKGGDTWPYSLNHEAIVESAIIGTEVV